MNELILPINCILIQLIFLFIERKIINLYLYFLSLLYRYIAFIYFTLSKYQVDYKIVYKNFKSSKYIFNRELFTLFVSYKILRNS